MVPTIRSEYDSIDPFTLMEEIVVWKTRERENALSIRSSAPDLEPVYVRWLEEWENVFDQTREYAERLTGQLREQSGRTDQENGPLRRRLLEEALKQSAQFDSHLLLLRQHSNALKKAKPSHEVFVYLERQPSFSEEALIRLQPSVPEKAEKSEKSPEEEQARKPLLENARTAPAATPDQPVPIGGHTLPPLPYAYSALEPYIDEKTMRIHHDKHHLSYVEGLNTAEKKLEEARRTGSFDLVKHWERELAFNGAGHYLHTLFWNAMSPKGGGKPTGALLDEINRSFGSYDAFKKQFTEAAGKVEDGGWAILVWSPRSHRLEILTAEKHQNLSQWDVIPLLPLDVWEHAYYLKHQNDRAAYVKDWWNVVNWPYVADRFAVARTVKWVPY